MVNSILCATDGSKVSAKAVDFAVGLAKQLAVPLAILTVERVTRASAAKSVYWDSIVLDAGDAITQAEFKSVAKKAAMAGIKGVQCTTVQSRNVPAAIVSFAKKNRHDHIVVGSHGHKGIQRLVLGSVAESVVAEAHCPVTVVR